MLTVKAAVKSEIKIRHRIRKTACVTMTLQMYSRDPTTKNIPHVQQHT